MLILHNTTNLKETVMKQTKKMEIDTHLNTNEMMLIRGGSSNKSNDEEYIIIIIDGKPYIYINGEIKSI